MTGWFLLAAFGLLIANAFFVAVEFALLASRVTRLEPMAEDGDDRRAAVALDAIRDLQPQLAGAQLGITMACLLYTSPSPRDKRQSRMPSSA